MLFVFCVFPSGFATNLCILFLCVSISSSSLFATDLLTGISCCQEQGSKLQSGIFSSQVFFHLDFSLHLDPSLHLTLACCHSIHFLFKVRYCRPFRGAFEQNCSSLQKKLKVVYVLCFFSDLYQTLKAYFEYLYIVCDRRMLSKDNDGVQCMTLLFMMLTYAAQDAQWQRIH